MVDESLLLLLEAHRQTRARVGIALTGSLLERMVGRHDACLARLAEAISDGIVEPLATTYHEVCPFLIPPRYLYRQVELDLAIKDRLFGMGPAAFWPGNLAWTPLLANVLTDLGLQTAIVDEAHLRDAHQTQLWHWLRNDSVQMESLLVDTLMTESVSGRVFRLQRSPDASLRLRIQSASMRRELSFGTVGAIHHAWDDAPLDAFVARLQAGMDAGNAGGVFSGDDGDRINPVSIHQYRRLLQKMGPSLESVSDPLAAQDAKPLDFLPAYAPGGMAFWQDSVAAAYLRLLDELYRAVDLGTVGADEVLPLQDVFPIFWKRIARARWFHERAWELLRRGHALR